MGEKYQALVSRLAEIRNINRAIAVLSWDQQVNMPPGGMAARAAQIGTLSRIEHDMIISDETRRLLEDASSEIDGMPYDSTEASMVRVVAKDVHLQTCLSTELVAKIAEMEVVGHQVWAAARANSDFNAFEPTLEQILDLKRQAAEQMGYTEHPYDALLNEYERGMTAARVKQIFDAHKAELVPLISAIRAKGDVIDNAMLHQPYDIPKQRAFGEMVVKAFGYDFNRGRQDEVVHPFCTNFSQGDVRITTRFYPDFLSAALFGTMHEAGHAMYEQGVDPSLEGTPLSRGTSLGVHESQSRMWENFVGRSRGFWEWAYPTLREVFPDQLKGVSVDQFYKAINKVQPSFIRVEADEATYNLHIMLRFELEMDMAAGKIAAKDLPEAWNEMFQTFLGVTPPNDRVGVLQDVHWSSGLLGYFPTYALGNLLAAQYYNKAVQDRPSIPSDIANGKFDTLLGWLRENIHQYGRKFTADELTQRITGGSIDSSHYTEYLKKKYTDIYGL
ncbi:MAG TPA: carboxypeptidase M32 [Phototrophicaceae bacterium]|nr:carboxypeptidase M32 [Phototrophicaceae bacterium]